MRAVVLGATGHVGNAIARELLTRGWQVTAAARRPERAANLAGLDVLLAPGDADAPGQVERWTAGQDLVVDAAAPYPLALWSDRSAALAHAEARTRDVIAATRRQGARLVHVSSFTTLAGRRDALAELESALARRAHPYFDVKRRMEDLVLEASTQGLSAVVVNPTLCLGPWDLKDRRLAWVASVVRGEVAVSVSHLVNVVDVRDVAVGALAALDAGRFGEAILLSGHPIQLASLCALVAETGGGRAPSVELPSLLAMASAAVGETLLSGARDAAWTPALALLLVAQHHVTEPGRAQRDLRAYPRPLSATVHDSIAWYRSIGYC